MTFAFSLSLLVAPSLSLSLSSVVLSHLSNDYSDPTDLKFGPAYSHLGSSNTIPGIRSLLQHR